MARKKRLLTRHEAAEALGLALRTIDQYLQDGVLERVKVPVGGRRLGTRITAKSIRAFQRDVAQRAG